MPAGTLLIRADASIAIGTGHVMRCLALAQAWQDAGGRAVFATTESTPGVNSRLASEQFEAISIIEEPENLNSTIALAQRRNADWVVLDGYQFTSQSQQALKGAGLKVLVVDDCGHATQYSCDAVLNQNISASEALYQDRDLNTRLLLGPRFALLRREFAAWRHWRRGVARDPQRLLVMMGGSDPQNITARVIEALEIVDTKLDTTVVVGPSNPHFASLEQAIARSQTKVLLVKDPQNLPTLMADADIAISAAGSTCWELCLYGLPALIIDIASNQTALAHELHQRRCAIHIGDSSVPALTIAQELRSLSDSQERRRTLSQNARQLVDGNGARRVVSALCERECVWLRPVMPEDRHLLFEWANDPQVRAASFSSDVISWEVHASWFERRLAACASGAGSIFIAEDENGNAVGQIRFDSRADGEWEVDVSLSSAMRGRGLGSEVIRRGVEIMRRNENRRRIHAFVKTSNLASIAAFERSAFARQGTESVKGHDAVHLISEAAEDEIVSHAARGKS